MDRGRLIGALALPLLSLAGLLIFAPHALRAQSDITVTAKSFSCIRTGTKVRNTYIWNPDPKLLAEAVRIFRDSVPNTEYPVGTTLQLVPAEAMVKHAPGRFPATNNWEFFALDLSAQGTKIKARGDSVVNFTGATCLGCHEPAKRYDFVCEKTHGCAPIPVNDQMIADIQSKDPRCPANRDSVKAGP